MNEYETALKEMGTMHEDTQITVCNEMHIDITEVKGSSSTSHFKDGFTEESKEMRTRFHWRIKGIASKIGMDIVRSDAFNPREQELYNIVIASEGSDIGFVCGFKTREDAIKNALQFAERNGIKIDGYRLSDPRLSK